MSSNGTMTATRKLTPKQRTFVAAYLVSLNATKAAIEAGYSKRTARQIGEENLSKPDIAAAVEAAMKARSERTEITADRVLKELARVAFFDIGKAFTPDGSLKPLDEMDEDTRRALAGLEVVTFEDGDRIGTLKKVKIVDKLGALTKIAQHLGMLDPKLTIKGSASDPLTLLIQQIQGNSFPVRQIAWGGDERDNEAVTMELKGKW